VECLFSSGASYVRVFDIRAPAPGTADSRVEYVTRELRRPADVAAAVAGCAVVFHVATAAPTGANAYNHEPMRSVNVDGTQNAVDSCVAPGVDALTHTSPASVVCDGNNPLLVDESAPYAAKPLDYYTVTKIEGEKVALAANGRAGLATAALRPSGIFGEYDLLTVPSIVEKAARGEEGNTAWAMGKT